MMAAVTARSLALGLVLILAAAAPVWAQSRTPPTSREAIHLSFAPVVKQVAPAVVNVYSRRVVQTRSPFFDDPLFRRFFGDKSPFGMPRERVQNSLGSGVIVDAEGLIVTNHHVINGAQQIPVVLSDRREFEAKVMLSDEHADLAVLKIDTHGERLPMLELGDSDQLEVGDLVLAIGDPFGVGQTVTIGIVSALARTGIGSDDFAPSSRPTPRSIRAIPAARSSISTAGSSASTPRSSRNRAARSASASPFRRRMVRTRARRRRGTGGQITPPWLGASGQEVTPELADALHLPLPAACLVKEVTPDGPAAQPASRIGDVILAVDGHEVADPGRSALSHRDPADRQRRCRSAVAQRRRRTVTVTLTALPETPPRQVDRARGRERRSPARPSPISTPPRRTSSASTTTPARRRRASSRRKRQHRRSASGSQPGDIIASRQRRSHRQRRAAAGRARRGRRPVDASAIRRNGQLFA